MRRRSRSPRISSSSRPRRRASGQDGGPSTGMRRAAPSTPSFPVNSVHVDARINRLPIGERQMVEIARAAATPGVRLIVLDEPDILARSRTVATIARLHPHASRLRSRLHLHQSQASRGRRRGLADRRAAQWPRSLDGRFRRRLGRPPRRADGRRGDSGRRSGAPGQQRARPPCGSARRSCSMATRSSSTAARSLVSPALRATARRSCCRRSMIFILVEAARRVTRIFPRASSRATARRRGSSPFGRAPEHLDRTGRASRFASPWSQTASSGWRRTRAAEQLQLDPSRFDSAILELSGGNQQKALVARAVAAKAPIVLLDDPTRGVDIAAKQTSTGSAPISRAEGRTLVWRTTEDAEFLPATACWSSPVAGSCASFRRIRRSRKVRSWRLLLACPRDHGGRAGVRRAQVGSWSGLARSRRPVSRSRARSRRDGRQSVRRLGLRARSSAHAGAVAGPRDGSPNVRCGRQRCRSRRRRLRGVVSVLSATWLNDRPAAGAFAIAAAVAAYGVLGLLISWPQDPGHRGHPRRLVHLVRRRLLGPADGRRREPRLAHGPDDLVARSPHPDVGPPHYGGSL